MTPREINIFALLQMGKTYKEIAHEMQMNDSCLHTHMSHIKKKTGIRDLKEFAANRRPSTVVTPYIRPDGPSKGQMNVLRLLAKGKSYQGIAALLGVQVQTVENAASVGCHRANIKGQGHNRLAAIREYVQRVDTGAVDPMADPWFQ